MNKKMAKEHGFKLQKVKRLLVIRNINRTRNSWRNIIHQVEVNMFYKNHVERMRINICNLGRTEVILEIPWL